MPTAQYAENQPALRIVSLLPGATEIVLALGLRDSLVAVSHSCNFPEVSDLPRVTSTRIPQDATSREIDGLVRAALVRGESLYQVDAELLDRVRPDLILTQGICQVCAVGPGEVADVMPMLRSSPQMLSLEPRTLDETFSEILRVGAAVGQSATAEGLVAELRDRVEVVRIRSERRDRRPRVVFLEWIDPLICGGHWNPELVALAGGEDGLGRPGEPSHTIQWEELLTWQPEVLVAACCGYSAERARSELPLLSGMPGAMELPCFRTGRVHVADGVALFSRPGPSLVASLEVLEGMLRSTGSAAVSRR